METIRVELFGADTIQRVCGRFSHSVDHHGDQPTLNSSEPGFDITASRDGPAQPYFTLAIPHYKRRAFLEENLRHAFAQRFGDFELLVSDDCSPDDSNEAIPRVLLDSGLPFRYYAQRRNLGYDGNVRFCLANARGKYVFLLGNDDALATPDVLTSLRDALEETGEPDVCITNYKDWHTGAVTQRAFRTAVLGRGAAAAAHYFRSFSFTSGLVYKRESAMRHDTARWDKSIYIQIFLACRILAAGGTLAGANIVAVLDHIRLDGKLVPETYRVRYADAPLSFKHKHTGLDSVARVTIDAISPFVESSERALLVKRIYTQLLTITYPFWLFEYRQLANWGMAWGIARDLWPAHQLAEYSLPLRHRVHLWSLYFAVTACGLIFPASLFNRVRGKLSTWIRKRRQRLVPG
jgi:glycosyltransferase involved in cell wall biosynthesis